ncbi:MAG: hypothetical protein LBQ08_01245 [Holosporaceae bacterium]|jgi:hypothetical protein|nr:hypothetical protein [Holosporaceae bacterium]
MSLRFWVIVGTIFSQMIYADSQYKDAKYSKSNAKESDAKFNDQNVEVRDFAGGYMGLGINVGLQKTSAEEKVMRASQGAYSTTFGISTSVGYQAAVGGKFLLGVEAGLDFGSSPSQLKVRNCVSENSIELLKRHYALSQIISSYCRTMSAFHIGGSPAISGGPWRNFLVINRYLGGATNSDIPNVGGALGPFDLVNPDGTPGAYISAFVNGAYSLLRTTIPNVNATFSSFVGQNTVDSITSLLGEGSLDRALRELRNYIISNNTDLAITLRSIGEQAVAVQPASTINAAAANVNHLAPAAMSNLFSGTGITSLDEIGIGGASAALLGNDETRVDEAVKWALSYNDVSQWAINRMSAKQIKTKSVFGMSPYVAFKAGYFFDELNACLYVKAGVMHMRGRLISTNNDLSIEENNFRKAAPFFAIGVNKKLTGNMGINFEVSRSLNVHKELTISTPLGFTMEHKAEINKTNFAAVLTFAI